MMLSKYNGTTMPCNDNVIIAHMKNQNQFRVLVAVIMDYTVKRQIGSLLYSNLLTGTFHILWTQLLELSSR